MEFDQPGNPEWLQRTVPDEVYKEMGLDLLPSKLARI